MKGVTSVSRSGRVRKKSSKLMDFESPDDLADSNLKKQPKAQDLHVQTVQERLEAQQAQAVANAEIKAQNETRNDENFETHDNPPIVKVEIKTEPEDHILGYESNVIVKEEDRHFVAVNIKEEVDPLYIDEREIDFTQSKNQETPHVASVLLVEKNRKSTVNNGKIAEHTKAPRSDKGKTRITSYMLWAKNVRQELLKKNSSMDFATVSKKLAELWASVSATEKYNLRRRAKRLAAKSK